MINAFYDLVHGLCCKYIFCLSPGRAPTSPPATADSFNFFLWAKDYRFKFPISGALLLVAAGITFVAWKTIELKAPFPDGKRKHLRGVKTFLIYLNRPKLLPTLVILSWFSFCFLALDQVIASAWPSPRDALFSDYVALSVAATAILFPLVILIMAEGDSEREGVFSNPEILLQHAFAFPISICLLAILGLSAFRMNFYWMRLVVVISVVLSAVALLRLLHVIFGPKARRRTEEWLMRVQAQDAILEIAHQRAGVISTNEKIKGFAPYLVTIFGLFNRDQFLEKTIKAGKTGRVISIDYSGIERAIRSLQPEPESEPAETTPTTTPKETKAKDSPKFQIVLRVTEAQIIDDASDVIAAIRYEDGAIEDEKIRLAIGTIAKAVRIDALAETYLSMEQIDVLLSRLRSMGRAAIQEEDDSKAERVASTYQSLVEYILETFESLGIKYTLEAARQESSFLGNDWKPFTRIFKDIDEWTARLYKSKDLTYSLKSSVIYTPYRLAMTAFSKRDLFTFTNAIRLAIRQRVYDSNEEAMTASWLESLGDQIGWALEKEPVDESRSSSTLDFLWSFLEIALSLAKMSIDRGSKKQLEKHLGLMLSHPKLFQFEDFESDIEFKESFLQISKDTSEQAVTNNALATLRQKHHLKEKLNGWRQELVVGLAAYCLLQLNRQGNPDHRPSDEFLRETFSRLLPELPHTFEKLLALRIRMSKREDSGGWGWEWWEHIPTGEAKAMSFHLYVDDVFAYLIMQSDATGGLKEARITGLNLLERDVADFREMPQSIRGKIKILNEGAAQFGITRLTEDQLRTLDGNFNRILDSAKLNSELRLVRQPLSASRISAYKQEFERTFKEKNRIRKIFPFRLEKVEKEENETSWGVNVLTERFYFVADPEIHFPDLGSRYGNDLGQSEEQWIFDKISEKAEHSGVATIAELLQLAVKQGMNPSSLLILSARNVHSTRALRAEPSFKERYQVDRAQIDDNADGYIEWGPHLIPVVGIFYGRQRTATGPSVVAVDRLSMEIVAEIEKSKTDILPETGFFFSVIDPLDESAAARKLKADLIQRNPEWLAQTPEDHRSELVGKYVWLRILERVEIEMGIRPVGMDLSPKKT